MRSMGRRESDASPISVKLPCCGASRPEIMRMVEPELPQSSGRSAGVTRPPTPVTSTDAIVEPADLRAQRLHAGERRGAVGAGGEVGEARSAFGKGAQHCVAMADGLVAGQAQASDDVACRADDAFLGCGGQWLSEAVGLFKFNGGETGGFIAPMENSQYLAF